MTDWQPIETAPYGEKVLVYSPISRFNRQAKYSIGVLRQYVGDEAPKWSLNGNRIDGRYSPPTAWMPLPPAPAEV